MEARTSSGESGRNDIMIYFERYFLWGGLLTPSLKVKRGEVMKAYVDTIISTGDIFRAHVAGSTELGRRARAYMDKGEYVPNSVTNAMVADSLAEDDAASGFLLDGYPRTAA